MLVRIVGGHGGVSPGFRATSYLIDGNLLIDAGSCASALPIEEQCQIDHILISHPHLDHIKDLAFICDNCFGMRDNPFEVYTNQTIIHAIKTHLMNETIWPDFSILPTPHNPTVRFNEIQANTALQLGEYKILPIHVNHPGDAMGFIVERGKTAVVFTQDTGPTDAIWEAANQNPHVKAIFCEVSFPNKMEKVAHLSQHHTPQSLGAEIKKMPPDIPIFLGHLKPNFQKLLYEEVKALQNERLNIMGMDDANYVF